MNNNQLDQTSGPIDVAVVGAGPSGLAAAATCAQYGLKVVVLDEQPTPGGQIYRGITTSSEHTRRVLGPDYLAGEPLVAGLENPLIEYRADTAVWEVTREKVLHLTRQGRSSYLQARHIVLATGAMERPFPISGWTLPGVMSAGAAQILLKTAGATAVGPLVLAGCGPLLYLLATQYLSAGAKIAAIVDTTGTDDYRNALRHLGGSLADMPTLFKGLKLLHSLKKADVPFFKGASSFKALGDDCIREFQFESGGRTHQIDTNVLLLHHGVVPSTQFTWSLRIPHDWSDQQLCWLPKTNSIGELDGADDIFIAGDGAAIIGAQPAALHGRAVGLEIAYRHGRLSRADHGQQLAALEHALHKARQFRRFLDTLYRPKAAHRVPADDVIVCRCEEVTAGDLRSHVALGCLGPNQAKSFSRCGMGPCQGRQCGLSVTEIIAAERDVSPQSVGYFRIRPPIKQVKLGELAED